jgi:hypothetical protein
VARPHARVHTVGIVAGSSGVAENANGALRLTSADRSTTLAGTAPTMSSGELETLVMTPSLEWAGKGPRCRWYR